MFKKFALGLSLVSMVPCAATFAAETQNAPAAFAAVDGSNASFVQYSVGGFSGNFTMQADGSWVERNQEAIYRFKELSRDQWSVYLQEVGNSKYIALDLWTMKVKITYSPSETYRPLYEISYAR